jgi:hypothetical protein
MTDIIEVIAPLDRDAAARLDKRIRLMAATARENLAKIAMLVDEAKAGQIHEALGFPSWTAYLADALGGQLELSTDTRRAVVELMAGEGMSQRAIATAVGVSQKTVDRDLDKVSHGDSPEPAPVTGLDGKTYTRPATPAPARRNPLKDSFAPAVQELGRVARRIEKLSDDDRFSSNQESLHRHLWDLVRARDAITVVIDKLTTEGDEALLESHYDKVDPAVYVTVVDEMSAWAAHRSEINGASPVCTAGESR